MVRTQRGSTLRSRRATTRSKRRKTVSSAVGVVLDRDDVAGVAVDQIAVPERTFKVDDGPLGTGLRMVVGRRDSDANLVILFLDVH